MLRATVVVCLGCVASLAAPIVVPINRTSLEGDGTSVFALNSGVGRTFQMIVGADQLGSIVGDSITGLTFRIDGPGSNPWPLQNANFSFFDIYVGQGVSPSAITDIFANNYMSARIQTRSGALSIAAQSFPFGSFPNSFGSHILFTTPYVYLGGNLAVEIRFSSHTGGNHLVADSVTSTGDPGNGWGVDFAAKWANNPTATTGSNSNFMILQLVSQESANRTLSGNVTLLDYEQPPSTQTVEIEIRNVGVTVPLETHIVVPNSDGSYSLTTALPLGTYDVTAKAQLWLRFNRPNVVVTETGANGVDFSLVNGDADPDNEVNLADVALIAFAFGTVDGDPNWRVTADLNGDGEVNLVDYSIASANFGQAGDD